MSVTLLASFKFLQLAQTPHQATAGIDKVELQVPAGPAHGSLQDVGHDQS